MSDILDEANDATPPQDALLDWYFAWKRQNPGKVASVAVAFEAGYQSAISAAKGAWSAEHGTGEAPSDLTPRQIYDATR